MSVLSDRSRPAARPSTTGGGAAPDSASPEWTVEAALAALRNGEAVVLVDDLDPRGTCDLVFAAEHATVQLVSFAVRHTSGFLEVALPRERADSLDLRRMVGTSGAACYGIAVDGRNTGTGISAVDRAQTISLLADPDTTPEQLTRPGHVMTYRAHEDGVLGAVTPAEAAYDLVRLAGTGFAAARSCLISERDPADIISQREAVMWTRARAIPLLTTSAVLQHRLPIGDVRGHLAGAFEVSAHGAVFRAVRWSDSSVETTVLVLGEGHGAPEVVEECVHSGFAPRGCDCRDRLASAMRTIAERGTGAVLHRRRTAPDLDHAHS